VKFVTDDPDPRAEVRRGFLASSNFAERSIWVHPRLLDSALLPFILAHETAHLRLRHLYYAWTSGERILLSEIAADNEAARLMGEYGMRLPKYGEVEAFFREWLEGIGASWDRWSGDWAQRLENLKHILPEEVTQ
jgi:hypothetical protein